MDICCYYKYDVIFTVRGSYLNEEGDFRDYNNIDLMNELQKQDTEYFEKIIRQQDEILKILKKGEIDNGR